MRTLAALALALLACRPLAAAVLGDEGPDPDPKALYRATVASLPTPSEEGGYSFEGTIHLGSTPIGRFAFSAKPVTRDGEPAWETSDSLQFTVGSGKRSLAENARLSRTLAAIDGGEEDTANGVKTSCEWTRSGRSVHLVTTKQGEDSKRKERDLPCPESPLFTGAAGILFCRLAGPGPATFKTTEFNLDAEGNCFEPLTIVAEGTKEWNGEPALLFTEKTGGAMIQLGLSPETKAVLGLRLTAPDGMTLDLVPAGGDAEPSPVPVPDGFAPPAKDALHAALIAALALGTRDGALLDRIVDWPSAIAVLAAKHPDRKIEVEAARKAILSKFDGSGAKNRDLVLVGLEELAAKAEVRSEGETRATVTLPSAHRTLTFHVGRFEDEWKLVRLSTKADNEK